MRKRSWARCAAPHCADLVRTAGYCSRHYQQVRRYGRLTPEREYHRRPASCAVDGCDRPVQARGYCWRHLQQVYRHGRITHAAPRRRYDAAQGCMVAGCEGRHKSRGFCQRHYMTLYYNPKRRGTTT